MSRAYQDPDTLRELYVDDRKSKKEIAEWFDVDFLSIHDCIQEHDINRSQSHAPYASLGGYPRWYNEDNILRVHQLLAIAEGEDPHDVFDDETVIHHKNGISLDNRPENIELMTSSEHGRHHSEERYGDKPWRDKQKLWEMYVEEGMTTYEIAEEWGCSSGTIRYNLQKFDIPIRKGRKSEYDHEPHPLRKW